MKRTFRLAFVAAMLAGTSVLLNGCSLLARNSFASPVVSMRDVRLAGIGLTGGSLNVVLNVYNPNGFRLDATRLSYRLLVDSTEVGRGAIDTSMNVQAGDSTRVTVPVDFTFAGLGAVAQRLQNRGTLDYRILGDLTVATPVGNFTRPYDQRGRYTLFQNVPLERKSASAGN